MKLSIIKRVIVFFLGVVCAGCSQSNPYVTTGANKDNASLKPVSYKVLPGWEEDDHEVVREAFLVSCKKWQGRSGEQLLGLFGGPLKQWQEICQKAQRITDAKAFFEAHFIPHAIVGEPEGLFTGYFEPILQGSRKRTESFTYPIYKKPKHYTAYSRAQINSGAIEGQDLELVYLDEVEAFFLHVQGSGRVQLQDGTTIRLNFAAKNGMPYTSIGGVLIREGALKKGEVTAQAIKGFLYAHPEEIRRITEQNASYIFFREHQGDGPIGGQGVALTPGRSLAIDKAYIPYGVPLYVETYLGGEQGDKEPFQRLMVAQDTGSAIKGKIRGDIFFGAGKEAGILAGKQQSRGSYYVFLPK